MSVGALLQQGGSMMYPIYLCSIVALAVFVKKVLELRAARLSDLAWLDGVLAKLKGGDIGAARGACDASPHPATRVIKALLEVHATRPDRSAAEAQRVGSLEIQKLEKNLALLSFIAQVAPLLGLLGTVLGMVDLFIGLQGSGMANVDVSQLSSGIWKALLTTAAGLSVAVPTLAMYSYLTARTDRLRLQLGDTVARVLTEAPAGEQ